MINRTDCQILCAVFLSAAASILAFSPSALAGDNSGRQLALIVPSVPKTHPPLPALLDGHQLGNAVPVTHENRERLGSSGGAISFEERSNGRAVRPSAVSPEMKAAIRDAALAAKELSHMALRRFADIAAWVATVWNQVNETPRLSPMTAPAVADQPVGPMQPITHVGTRNDMYFTSQGRVKMVVAR